MTTPHTRSVHGTRCCLLTYTFAEYQTRLLVIARSICGNVQAPRSVTNAPVQPPDGSKTPSLLLVDLQDMTCRSTSNPGSATKTMPRFLIKMQRKKKRSRLLSCMWSARSRMRIIGLQRLRQKYQHILLPCLSVAGYSCIFRYMIVAPPFTCFLHMKRLGWIVSRRTQKYTTALSE